MNNNQDTAFFHTSLERYRLCGHFEYKNSKIWVIEGPNQHFRDRQNRFLPQVQWSIVTKLKLFIRSVVPDIGLGILNPFLNCEYHINS